MKINLKTKSKRPALLILLPCALLLFFTHGWRIASAAPKPELVISTYDSIASPTGLGGKLFPLFEKRCGCKVKVTAAGDAGTLASRLELEAKSGRVRSHVVLGVDELLWPRIEPFAEPFQPNGVRKLLPEIQTGVKSISKGFVPFDHGVFAFMLDTRSRMEPPRTLGDLTSDRFKKRFILEDPRTSTPGLAFLHFTRSVMPEKWENYWAQLAGHWLTLSPGWDQAYGMFLKEEAPLVWSYTTSQAYHRLHGDPEVGTAKPRYQAVVFEDAMPVQVEGAAMVRGLSGPTRKLAEKFLEFLISEEAQALIPEGNWMLPVRAGIQLPNSAFSNLPRPRQWIHLNSDAESLKDILARWNRAVHR